MRKRDLEIVILSDVHLGTFACHAWELLNYLKSIHPKMLILNGDFIDIWDFRKRYFPSSSGSDQAGTENGSERHQGNFQVSAN